MGAPAGSPNRLDEVRRRLEQEALIIATAEAEQLAAETAPPPRSKFYRYRQPILVGAAVLVIAVSAVVVFSVYRYYNPPVKFSAAEINAARVDAAAMIAEELKRRGIRQPVRERDDRSLDELRRRPLVDREENLNDIPARTGGRLGEP